MILTAGTKPFAVELSLYPSQQLRSVATEIRTPNLPHARRMFQPTVSPPRRISQNQLRRQNIKKTKNYLKDQDSMIFKKTKGWGGVLCYAEGLKMIYQFSEICTDVLHSD